MALDRFPRSARWLSDAPVLLAISLALIAAPTIRAQQTPAPAPDGSFIDRYQARVLATQNEQPHWVTPLVTVTPRLEQELRTGFVHQYNTSRFPI
jgi:hypothetical protein